VENSPHRNATTSAQAELGRRQFMRKAAVAGAIVWTVPTIVSIEPAGAAAGHSGPPVTSTTSTTSTGGVHQQPPPPSTVGAKQQQPGGQLPFTGDNQSIEVGVGVAAVTAGAAMLLLSAEAERGLEARDT